MIDESDWFEHSYDDLVGAEVDGMEREKLRDAMARDYLVAMELGEIRAPSEMDVARAKSDQYMSPLRKKRSKIFRKELEELLASLNSETMWGIDDPRLQQAFPVGDGKDKKLAYWTVQDFMTAIKVRQQNVQRAAHAATELTEIAEAIVGEMIRRNVRMAGEMCEPKEQQ